MVKNKTAVVASGRFQGIHHGHALLVNGTIQRAKALGADHYIYPTRTHDTDKNPIPHDEKVGLMRRIFPHANIQSDPEVRNPIEAVKKLSKKGYRHVKLIAGQDRIEGFQKSIGSYIKKKTDKDFDPKKHIDLDSFEVVSAGDRDPDAEGVEGASGSKMREYVRNNDMGSFAKSVPSKSVKVVRDMFNSMKRGMAAKKQLKEEITHKEFGPMLDSFVAFASDTLGIESMPKVRYKNGGDDYNSFAAYNPNEHELSVSTKNRHPMDVFRSVAHELVHHKQKEENRIGKDIAKEGETGSDVENEANAKAGVIMRMFAKKNPKMFEKSYVVETNTAAMAPVSGIRGLGNVSGEVSPTVMSQYVIDNQAYTEKLQSNSTEGLWISDDPYDDFNWYDSKEAKAHRISSAKGIRNSTSGLWVDTENKRAWLDQKGTNEYQKKAVKGFKAVRSQLNEGINDPGKLKAVFLAGGPGSGKDFVMNKALAGNGLREINSDTAFEYLMAKHGLDFEMPDEERIEREIVRGRAKNITNRKEINSLSGRLGLIVNGTADDIEKIKTVKAELEDLGYDTMMVFVNTSDEVSRQRNVDRGKGGGRKVPDGTDKQGVPNDSPNIRKEKWDLAQENIDKLANLFGKDSFTVIDNTADIRKVSPEEKNKIETEFSRVRRMTMQFVQSPVKNKRGQDWTKRRARYQGTTQYTPPKAYTTVQKTRPIEAPKAIVKPSSELMDQARRLGLSYYGFGRFGRKVGGVNKVLYHSKGNQLVKVQSMNEEKKMGNPCWKGYKAYGMKKKNGREVPNCVPANEAFETFVSETDGNKASNREWGTTKLTNLYKKMTPGEKKKPVKKALNQEANTAPEPWGYNFGGDGIGPTFPTPRAGTPYGFGYGGSYSSGISESIVDWMKSEKTQQKFMNKYGNLWEEKLIEAAVNLEQAGCGCDQSEKKSIKKLREGMEGGVNNMGTVPVQRKDEDEIREQTPDAMGIMPRKSDYIAKFPGVKGNRPKEAQYDKMRAIKHNDAHLYASQHSPTKMIGKIESRAQKMHEEQLNERGADSKGLYRSTESGAGLTRKGAKHFGIKTAVTTPPSKLDPKGKAAKRRKSFCARMGGMKGPMKDEKGRPTRKAMSLRRWNCEE